MDTVKRGYYGLVERPKFEDAVDASKTALRIPVPDRKYKRQIFSLYREKLLENEKLAAGFELNGYEYRLKDAPVPESVIHVQPSPSADDALFEVMARQQKAHWETVEERRMRHRIDEETRLQYSSERHAQLVYLHTQGHTSQILQGEVPLDERFAETVEPAAAFGHVIPRKVVVRRGAPQNLPQAAGRPAQPEFPTFRELNMGQIRLEGDMAGQELATSTAPSYESLRQAANVPLGY